MADKKISELTSLLSTDVAIDDVMPIVDTSATETKKISASDLRSYILPDSDKGDITVSASGATWTIDNSAVTYAKMQNVSATDRLLGRSTAGAGVVQEITCTAFGRALIDDTSVAAQRTTLGATTVGGSFFTLVNPSAITFPQINANNTVTALTAANFRTAIGAGTSSTTGTVTSVAATAGTGIAITGSPITTSGTFDITNTAPDQVVSLTAGSNITITGTYPSFTIASSGGGSMTYPSAGIALSTGTAWGTSITDNSSNWNTAYGWGNHASAGYLTSSSIGTTVQAYNLVLQNTTSSFTTADKTKLDGIASGAEVNVNADWNSVSGDAQILNKPTLGTAASTASTDYATAAQGAKADTALQPAAIGVSVQAYDAQLADVAGLTATDNGVIIGNGTNFVVESGATLKTSLGLTIGTDIQAYDADTAKLDVAQSWTAQQTFKELKDTVHTITDGAAFEIDPANGSIQTVTLGASRTPAATNFEAGQIVLLGIDDGTAYSITWTTVAVTWVKAGGTASAPTLATTGYTWVLLWKVNSTIYGIEVGKP